MEKGCNCVNQACVAENVVENPKQKNPLLLQSIDWKYKAIRLKIFSYILETTSLVKCEFIFFVWNLRKYPNLTSHSSILDLAESNKKLKWRLKTEVHRCFLDSRGLVGPTRCPSPMEMVTLSSYSMIHILPVPLRVDFLTHAVFYIAMCDLCCLGLIDEHHRSRVTLMCCSYLADDEEDDKADAEDDGDSMKLNKKGKCNFYVVFMFIVHVCTRNNYPTFTYGALRTSHFTVDKRLLWQLWLFLAFLCVPFQQILVQNLYYAGLKTFFSCRFCGDIQILTEAALSQSQSSETSYFIAIESQFVSLYYTIYRQKQCVKLLFN